MQYSENLSVAFHIEEKVIASYQQLPACCFVGEYAFKGKIWGKTKGKC